MRFESTLMYICGAFVTQQRSEDEKPHFTTIFFIWAAFLLHIALNVHCGWFSKETQILLEGEKKKDKKNIEEEIKLVTFGLAEESSEKRRMLNLPF